MSKEDFLKARDWIMENRIAGFIVVYILLNIFLWGGQELYWLKDTREIKKIESYLGSEKGQISLLESEIENQSNSLESKQQELDNFKNRGSIEMYNSGVDDYNYLLQKYKDNVDIYNGKLTEYNYQVDRVNELIKKSSSRWYLIPIPIPGRSIKTKI